MWTEITGNERLEALMFWAPVSEWAASSCPVSLLYSDVCWARFAQFLATCRIYHRVDFVML
jgi:hypothetical protein